MRTFLFAFIFTIATSIFLCPDCFANEPDKILHNQCLYPTIQITTESKATYGTAIIIRSVKVSDTEYHNVFITACHVAQSREPYLVKLYTYENWSVLTKIQNYRAMFYAADIDRDLAVGVFISDQKMPTAQIDMKIPFYIGSDVCRIGCGLGDEPRLDYGKITSLRNKLPGNKYFLIRTSVHTLPGDSGAALFNQHKVVGISRSIRSWNGHPVFNVSHYVPIAYLKDWSDETSGSLEFVWKDDPLPKLLFWELNFSSNYEITRNH